MLIQSVSFAVSNKDLAADFYEGVLELPVSRGRDQIEVTVGTTTLEIQYDAAHLGHHHLAITIPSNKFDAGKQWISDRVDLLALDGVDEFEASPFWNARSVYFMSADGTILEFIARRELENASDGPFSGSDLLCISEVGVTVDDVPSSTRDLSEHGILPYGWNAPDFAPVGDVNGLLILVASGRSWFPTKLTSQPNPITVRAQNGTQGSVTLAPGIHLALR